MRTQLTLDPAVATELAGAEDTVLKALEGHLDADVFLRGNVLTLEGSESDVQMGREVVQELAELIAAYLPEQLSDEELRAIVGDVVAETGASSPKEMGQVMSQVMPKV